MLMHRLTLGLAVGLRGSRGNGYFTAFMGGKRDVDADLVVEGDGADQALVHEAVDRELVSQAIRLAGGNQAEAARWLGISRLTLRAKLRALGLHPSQQMDRQSDFELPTDDKAV